MRAIKGLDSALDVLMQAAEREGHRFVRRLVDDWRAGANRFNRPGELLFGAYVDGRLVAVGGLNRDPYADDARTGRVRHVYVLPEARRSGVGQALLQRIVTEASPAFEVLRLRTTTQEGAAFYAALGFTRTGEADATHRMAL